ncbi:replicative DNA helicase [Oceanobacillus arenosus]|uniref:Replicative DNA helicase n=1 Tax=Oceanobacillus arenosus TaxID=1229153 RepID=A0A3D8PLM2_9BACI|nr:replicative DNA helicase [Oceanobacillus arenosus]RDW16980.1 replicative DNA helicase [Oceanobacillus arenosus]
MDTINIAELTSGYRDRIRRLALMDPLVELSRKHKVDKQEKALDMLGLGMLTLLFFFERRLSREYKTGVKHLAAFLRNISKETYIIEEEDAETLARTIIQTFRPTTGVKRSYSFYNWEKNTEELIEYSILKDNDFDLKTNTQYYTLDEDGLELIFATKEFYSEFQISINQLLLRQQIQKGEFQGALRQIREMEIDVDTLKERMEKVKLEILRSIVSEETFERYKKLLEDTYLRLEREDEEFKALKTFITETSDVLYTDDTRQKEKKSYHLIIQITKELEKVHYDHSRLLELTADLKNTALATAQESLYYTGIQSFNFDKDIVSTILAKPLPPEAMKAILHPFLKVEENRFWSPMTVLAEQNITEEQEERADASFIEAKQQEEDHTYRKWLADKYLLIMQLFIVAYRSGNGATLQAFMEYLQEEDATLLAKRYFYSFWILLHQRSPISYGQTVEDEEKTLLGEALRLLGEKQLVIKETKEVLHYHERYSIQNMMIRLEEDADELS